VVEILPDTVRVQGPEGLFDLPTDYTFALTGYRPDLSFLSGLRLAEHDDQCLVLSEQYESSVPGLFVVGSAGFAGKTNQVFIENGRFHADHAMAEIVRQLKGQEELAPA